MAAEVEMPNIQVLNKLREIPLVDLAYNTSTDVYKRVKSCHSLINWTLDSAEMAMAMALFTVAPVANKFEQPIKAIDETLCKGVEALQNKVPLVKEQPIQICTSAINYVATSAPVEKVQEITNKGWTKANDVLAGTPVGHLALEGLDRTSHIADRCIDYYLPAAEGEDIVHPHPSSECDDKIMHTAHTVGTLSYKVGHRVYRSLSQRRTSTGQKSIARSSQSSSSTGDQLSDEEGSDLSSEHSSDNAQ